MPRRPIPFDHSFAPGVSPIGRARRARRRGQGGAAFVEGVVLLFFMIIIFAGIQYLAHYFAAGQKAAAMARRCAWQFSKDACVETDKLPAYCADVFRKRTERNDELAGATNPEGTDSAIEQANGSTDAESREVEDNMRGGFHSKLNGMLSLITGETVVATGQEKVPRPALLATSAVDQHSYQYYIPCNLKDTTPLEVVKSLWSDMGMDIP